jgi:hypothetical protein
MAGVKGTIKASLVGDPTPEPPIIKQIQSRFLQHARVDNKTGDLYMAEEDFIDAIAPKQEDYVSSDDMISVHDVVELGMCDYHGVMFQYEMGADSIFCLPKLSIKSNENSTGFYSEWQIGGKQERSISMIGPPLKTCWRNRTQNMR